ITTLAMNTLLCTLCLNFVLRVMTQDRHFRVKLNEFSVKFKNPEVIRNADFRLSQLENRSIVNGEMSFKSDIMDISLRTTMDFWKINNTQKKFKLYDIHLDACLFLNTLHRNSLFNIYVKSFKKHTNAELVCPLKKNFNYSLNNWYMDERELPSFIPLGTFRTNSEYFSLKRLLLRVVTYGKVYPYP
ncbi:hypothetical protein KR018_002932, partial [Drosophila ironensis]